MTSKIDAPLIFDSKVQAGFPSPADDYSCAQLDLNKFLATNSPSVFFVKVAGDSMVDEGILPGDILLVDRSIENYKNKIIIAVINNEMTVKRLEIRHGKIYLVPANRKYKEILFVESEYNYIWGVVNAVIRKF